MNAKGGNAPQATASWADDKAKNLIYAFLAKLNQSGCCCRLEMNTQFLEFNSFAGGKEDSGRGARFFIDIAFQRPCHQIKAEREFKDLIKEMRNAGYRSIFGHSDSRRPKAYHFFLNFIKD